MAEVAEEGCQLLEAAINNVQDKVQAYEFHKMRGR
jgi:hypothetical protein